MQSYLEIGEGRGAKTRKEKYVVLCRVGIIGTEYGYVCLSKIKYLKLHLNFIEISPGNKSRIHVCSNAEATCLSVGVGEEGRGGGGGTRS